MIDVSRSRSPLPRPLRLPEGSDHRVAQLPDEPFAEGIVGENADELEDRLRALVGEEREQRIAQVVLHLRAGEPWPEVLEQVDELRRHELVVAGRPALEEVEAARMGSVGEPQDVDPADRRARDPAQDVGDQVAVRVDDRRADVGLDRRQREIEQERALARAGRPERDDVARKDRDRDRQRPTARLRHDEAELARTGGGWRCGERSVTDEAGPVEGCVGQVPELRELPVGEAGARRIADRATLDLPADLLVTVAQRMGEVDEPPEERLGLVGREPGNLENQADIEAHDAAALPVLGVTLLGRERGSRRRRPVVEPALVDEQAIDDRRADDLADRGARVGRRRCDRLLPCLGRHGSGDDAEPDLGVGRRGLDGCREPVQHSRLGPLGLSQRPGRRRGKATYGDRRRRGSRDGLADVDPPCPDRASEARSRRAPRPGGW